MQILVPFLKNYWKHILVVLLSAVYIGKTQYDYAVLYKMHMGTIEMYQDQMDKLNDIHLESVRKKNKAIEEYQEKIKLLEEEYKKKSEKIVIINKETEKKYKKKFNDNPKEIVKDIENTFGFSHVE
tara:strand:+ start:2397 stop:2774 length:378 start_codon:yes stop_codon:yes gene_type:complete